MAATSGAGEKKQRPKATHPTYFEMAKDAIISLGDKKGSTVPAIQSYIAGKYAIDTDVVRVHLRPALAKGLENGAFTRPKYSDAKGYTGRFMVDKVKEAKDQKEKLAKEKKKKEKKEKAASAVAKKSPKTKAAAKKKDDKKKTTAKKSTPKKTTTKKTVAKKSPKKTAEKKPKAAKATLKTPKKTPKTLKAKKTPKAKN